MGTILKKESMGVNDVRTSRFNLVDIEVEAKNIVARANAELDRAKAEARDLLEAARAEAEVLHENAREEGYKVGYDEALVKGFEDGRQTGHDQALDESRKTFTQQANELRIALLELLSSFNRQRHGLISGAQQDLLALALAISEKVTRQHIDADPTRITASMKSAVELVASRSVVHIRMNPREMERLNLFDEATAKTLFGLAQVKFIADETVEPNGWIVQTAGGEIDGQVSTQVTRIVEQLAPNRADDVARWQKSADTAASTPTAHAVEAEIDALNDTLTQVADTLIDAPTTDDTHATGTSPASAEESAEPIQRPETPE